MNNRPNAKERAHLARVKSLQCSVCDAPAPSEAHHVRQHVQTLAVALCTSCHRDGFNGWHGQRRIWSVKRMDELDALAITLQRLLEV